MSYSLRNVLRNLRENQTEVETIFWKRFRNRQVLGKRFARQYPIYYEIDGSSRLFIVDFYCSEHRLIIELDGSSHNDKQEHDQTRDMILHHKGLTVMHIQNCQILNNFEHVITQIKHYLRPTTPPLWNREEVGR
ncbi:MAG: DUF559 domain-containing protein [Candidatus Margulisbacteria bacterium]|nr:DUF559 domain-containing protein [Candidatus Margulisiibacteriota bacterium]